MTRETRTERARDLRQRQTFAETKFWQAVRGSRLDGLRFRRQHPIDRYFADFACESLRLVVELDGKVHDEDDQQLYDYHRQQEIEALAGVSSGLRTIRSSGRFQPSSTPSAPKRNWPAP